MSDPKPWAELYAKIENRDAVVGIIGLGYVGLPLAVETVRAGYRTVGIDIDDGVVAGVNRGESHVKDVDAATLRQLRQSGMLEASSDLARLAECDVISICVPTPLNKIKDPDLSYVLAAGRAVTYSLRPGQIIILESTTFPGTTREVLLPILEESELKVGQDFFVCFSPERVDPGNPVWHTGNTPKVLGGITQRCADLGVAIYSRVFETIVPVSSAEAAELVKVYENTFRMINIALANELAQACEKLDVDVWEVVEAAATKPFGFMKFVPGPGLGGHCIPLDPHYLSWKMRTLAFKTRMIEVASEINSEMPQFVVRKVSDALNEFRKPLNGSKVLVLGVAYKKDINDLRESPALEIMRLLQEKGAEVYYHDSHCPVIGEDGHTPLDGLPMESQPLTAELLNASDCALVITDHTAVDYAYVAEHAGLVVDTRGVMRGIATSARVFGLSVPIERRSGERGHVSRHYLKAVS